MELMSEVWWVSSCRCPAPYKHLACSGACEWGGGSLTSDERRMNLGVSIATRFAAMAAGEEPRSSERSAVDALCRSSVAAGL
jgi:hypothetical protein